MKKLMRFFKDEDGATAPEYALMLGLIAVVVILAVTAIGTSSRDTFQAAADAIGAAT